MEKFRFLNWQVYVDSKKLFGLILGIVKDLPQDLRFNLSGQLIRSAYSIILNIAEGSGKNSDKELNRYFDIALGSCYELLASVDTLKDENLISSEKFQDVYDKISNISNQLGGFKRSIKKL
jgi:four helix bundle protein